MPKNRMANGRIRVGLVRIIIPIVGTKNYIYDRRPTIRVLPQGPDIIVALVHILRGIDARGYGTKVARQIIEQITINTADTFTELIEIACVDI